MVQPQQTHRPPLRPVLEAYVTVTAAAYTAKAGDRLIGVNRAGAVTITFPTTQLRSGRTYTIKDESGAAATNNITVATEGTETVDGSASDTISENYGSKTYYSDGSNWYTVPLLAVGSHSLASHSSEAHSELSAVGTDDHHAKAHQADHNSGGADALKIDDLAAPDDNTDLDYSTTKHGLVPKGTNTGSFLKDDGTWAAPSGGGTDISARVTHSAATSLSNATTTTLAFDTERFDTDAIHDTSTNNSRLTCKTAGKYIIVGHVRFASNTSGRRFINITLNSVTVIAVLELAPSLSSTTTFVITTIYDLAVNDYVELLAYQSSGGALDVTKDNQYSPEFGMVKVLG